MILSAIILFFLASILCLLTIFLKKENLPEAISISFEQFIIVLPRLPVALIAAGFITVLLPEQMISNWIGKDSGLTGIMIASVIGVVIPSGPIVSFPIAFALYNLGAGTPQLIAFLTGWSIFQISRLLLWEVPFLGWSFVFRRLMVSLPLPFIAAGIAALFIFI